MPRWLWQGKILVAAYGMILPTCAIVIEAAFLSMGPIEYLRGENLIPYLSWVMVAGGAFLITILLVNQNSYSLPLIWLCAIIFRITVLFSGPPSLSDDVFRYLWDGHMMVTGSNPYLFPVNAQVLDALATPLRSLVNHNWMASPYLPAAQLVFGLTEALFSQKVFAYQVMMSLFDLATGVLVGLLLHKYKLPGQLVIIYLWNPLTIMEYAHSAHIDAWMIFLSVAAISMLLIPTNPRSRYIGGLAAVPIYAGAILTKGIPLLLFPVISKLLGWRKTIAAGLILISACLPFVYSAGSGLAGPLDGTGLFGAIRIYNVYWNYNSSIYHWIEILLAGYATPGAIPYETGVSQAARMIVGVILALVLILTLIYAWLKHHELINNPKIMWVASIPISAYLMLTPTLHPWYVLLIIPFLPFILAPDSSSSQKLFAFSWIILSITVNFSYLTYINESDFREYKLVRFLEYAPFYFLIFSAILMKVINFSGVKTQKLV
jgi:alpha-1,6-mannosyltransferase